MNKVKILTITTIGLLICNIVLVVFLIIGKPHPPRFEGPRKVIIERLDFDQEQIKDFELLIEDHQAKVKVADQKMRLLKGQLMDLLKKEENGLEKDQIKQKIGWQQQEIEELHFQHLLEIKNLCKGEQIEKFNELSKDLSKIFSPRKPKPIH